MRTRIARLLSAVVLVSGSAGALQPAAGTAAGSEPPEPVEEAAPGPEAADLGESGPDLDGSPSARVTVEASSPVPAGVGLERGRELLAQGKPAAALEEFRAALAETRDPGTRLHSVLGLGSCYEKLAQPQAAADVYRTYLEDLSVLPEHRPPVERSLAELKRSFALLRLSVGARGSGPLVDYLVLVDGETVARGVQALYLVPGSHRVEIRASGFASLTQSVVAQRGAETRLSFEMVPEVHEDAGLPPAYFWTGAGLTVVAAGFGTAFGLAALGARSDVDRALAAGLPRSLRVGPEEQGHISDLAAAADVCFVGAGVFAAVSVALGFATDFHRNAPRLDSAPLHTSLRLEGARLTLTGAF